jgi:hypothetical protein
VDAPEGTPADAVIPFDSPTVTDTVGLPRESRISNALMLSIFVIVLSPLFWL